MIFKFNARDCLSRVLTESTLSIDSIDNVDLMCIGYLCIVGKHQSKIESILERGRARRRLTSTNFSKSVLACMFRRL